MKRYMIGAVWMLVTASLPAQNAMDDLLRNIEQNNKGLRANEQLTRSKKLEASVGNTLPDPTISYDYLWGSPRAIGKSSELNVSQSFDFPTVYSNRSKLSGLKGSLYDHQGSEYRQQILLNAKDICLDLIYLNQQKEMLNERLRNAENLSKMYAKRLQTGDANVLEVNKIDLELLNVKTWVRMNAADREAKLRELSGLNGNEPISFAENRYTPVASLVSYEVLREEALSADRQLKSLFSEKEIARREVSLSKSLWLPKFELGYRRETGLGEQSNGFTVGVSIPLYENRNRVKQAKAQAGYMDLQIENTTLQAETTLRNLYEQAVSLKASMDEYDRVIKSQNNLSLLSRALEAGQISMVEYFVDVTMIYQSLDNFMQLENQYQKVMAQIYKFRL